MKLSANVQSQIIYQSVLSILSLELVVSEENTTSNEKNNNK